MDPQSWKLKTELKAKREQERRNLEASFNAEIIRRHKAGQSKEQIVVGLGITNTLFNRVIRESLLRQSDEPAVGSQCP